MKTVWTAAVLLAGAVLAGVGSTAQSSAVSYAKDVTPILERECVKCHDAKEHKGKLDLSAGEGYRNLVGVPSSEVETIARVKPGDPAASYLWLKLQHRTDKGSGMPKGLFFARKLSDRDLDLIRSWIEGGAQP